MTKKKVWGWSQSPEFEFIGNYMSRKDATKAGREAVGGQSFYVGWGHWASVEEVVEGIDFDDLLEEFESRALDPLQCGRESGSDVVICSNTSGNVEWREMIISWLRKHAELNWWIVDGVEEVE